MYLFSFVKEAISYENKYYTRSTQCMHACLSHEKYRYSFRTWKISAAWYVSFPLDTVNAGNWNGGSPFGMVPVNVKGVSIS